MPQNEKIDKYEKINYTYKKTYENLTGASNNLKKIEITNLGIFSYENKGKHKSGISK